MTGTSTWREAGGSGRQLLCGSRLQGISGSIHPMLADEYESQLMVLKSERSGWGGRQSKEASGLGWKWRSRRQGKKESEGQLQEAAGRRPNTVRCSRINGVKHQRRAADDRAATLNGTVGGGNSAQQAVTCKCDQRKALIGSVFFGWS